MRVLSALAPFINLLPDGIIRCIGYKASAYLLNRYADLEVTGSEILSERIGKPTIFISNHLSNVDGLVLNKILNKNDVTFMAGVKLKANSFTSIFMKMVRHIEINPNTADRKAIKKALGVLKTGGSILIFPEGTRSRTGSMIKGRRGFLLLAKLSGVDFVPIALQGTEKLLPLDPENMSNEVLQHAKVKVSIGQKFQLDTSNNVSDDDNVTTAMMKIAQMLGPEYQGEYNTSVV